MEKIVKLNMVHMPNFLTIAAPPRPRQDGFQVGGSYTVAVEELTQQEAEEYAEEMKQAFIEHWRRRINSPK